MQYKTLGKIGIKISPVGLDCMGLSHAFGTLLGKWEAADKVRVACDLGYTLFDTAECYTETNPDGTTAYPHSSGGGENRQGPGPDAPGKHRQPENTVRSTGIRRNKEAEILHND